MRGTWKDSDGQLTHDHDRNAESSGESIEQRAWLAAPHRHSDEDGSFKGAYANRFVPLDVEVGDDCVPVTAEQIEAAKPTDDHLGGRSSIDVKVAQHHFVLLEQPAGGFKFEPTNAPIRSGAETIEHLDVDGITTERVGSTTEGTA